MMNMTRIILLSLVFVSPVFAGDTIPEADTFTVAPGPMNFVLSGQSKTIVTIHPDGTVALGEGITINEASKAFWAELQREGMKLACQKPAP
jgi:hypothetical protein